MNTRYTYLSDQRNDVEGQEELLGIIEEITKQMTEIFATSLRYSSRNQRPSWSCSAAAGPPWN